ncbi:MAG: SAM-dependent methyltransferase [Candidatus Peribacteraceae bacterium]|nr:SAM-dependent methyltransferase [Candidatus Peribacteraceae bacterium]
MTFATLQDVLFSDVAGYSLSASGKAAIDREADPALTYGECTPEAVEHILSITGAKPGEVFYDLGSGTGKMVVFAAFFMAFKKSVGVELLPELHEAAQMVGKRYMEEIQPKLEDDRRDTKLEYRLGDIFEADLSDADIVVSHCCTCFDDALMQKLSDKLESCKPGTRIVTVTRALSSPAFESVGVSPVQMGWGQATANVYLRR